ncbi:MAG: DUF4118 domain-containing protein [Bordetella sp.]|uniref:DUF4118 domain-containing protein n=1 Tax=Bordetella sp. TaxID=28081 RepID=UPI003F7C59B3
MQVRNARRWAQRGPRVWLAAAAILSGAVLIRLLLHPVLGSVMPAGVFYIAAALIEYYYGLAPALVAMLLGLGLADYLFVPPYFQVFTITQRDIELAVSYPLITSVVIVLIERLRRAEFRAKLFALVAQSRYEMVLRDDNERAIARRAVDETHRLVLHLAQYNRDLVLIQALERAGGGERAALPGIRLPVPNEIAPGPRFAELDSDDLRRLRGGALMPGRLWVRLRRGEDAHARVECVCERFVTHAGDFLVLRVQEQA